MKESDYINNNPNLH